MLDAEVVGEPGVLRMQPELVKAACDKAHSLGMIVAAHVESPEGVMAALQNGVDSIEHGAQPSDEMIALFKQRKAFQISTISPALPYALFDRSISHATYEQQENGKIVFDGIVALAKANLAAGVPVGLGTDVGCPYITHYDMWRELHYFVKYCGVTPAFALYSATKLNARLAGIGDLTGSIEEGKQADLIVCTNDPLRNLSALRELDMVVKGGYRIDKPQIKKMDEVERELDQVPVSAMKYLVLSDSHGNVDNMVRAVELVKPQGIIHLGDGWRDVEELHQLYPRLPLEQVPGNCDFGRFEALERVLILDDHRVLIAHGHTLGVKTGLLRAQYRALEMNADILLFGHTHVPLVDAASRPMMMNPGSIGDPRRPTYGVLEFRNGQIYPSVFRLDA